MSPLIRWFIFFVLIVGTLFVISNDQKVREQVQNVTDTLAEKIGKVKDEVVNAYPDRSCDEPLIYTLGNIDNNFGLSHSQIVSLLKEAEDIWEQTSGRDLFAYAPDSTDAVKVNFIFDERQLSVINAKKFENDLSSKWLNFENLVSQYEKLSDTHNEILNAYEENVNEYEVLLKKFNRLVDDWNEEGGSQAEYRELKDDEFFIETVFQGLEKEREKINKSVESINELASQIESIQNELNRQTDMHNESFGGENIVNSGDFDTYDVNIYQFFSTPDLRLILAHELAHALGLDHVENQESIMYYLLDKQNLIDIKPTVEDLKELELVCE